MNTTTDKTLPAQAEYCRAYSSFLIDGSDRPKAEVFGISEELAEVLRRQCRTLAHKQSDAKRPAVSFTETEARKAAEDLRELANMLCEDDYPGFEKICRTLAQKFDTWRKE